MHYLNTLFANHPLTALLGTATVFFGLAVAGLYATCRR